MIRLLAVPFAAALFGAPLLALPAPALVVTGGIGLLLAAAGLAALWRAPVTVAAGVFLANYTVALAVTRGPVNLPAAAGVGLALLCLLGAADLACRGRDGTVAAAVVRAELATWLGVGAAALGAVVLALILAGSVAPALPPAAAPLVAAAATLGIVSVLAALISRGARATARPAAHPGRPAPPALDGRPPAADSVREAAPGAPGARMEP